MPSDATSITIGGYKCWDEGAGEDLGRDSSTATRIILCRWDDRIGLATYLRGYLTVIGFSEVFIPAQYHPDIGPGMIVSRVQTAMVVGNDGTYQGLRIGAHGMIACTYARLTVTYSTHDTDANQQIGAPQYNFSSESTPLPSRAGGFKFASDDAAIEVGATPHVYRDVGRLVIPKKNVATIPQATIDSLLSTVNNATYHKEPAGYLLFRGCETYPKYDVFGNLFYDLLFIWGLNRKGWNKMPRFDTNGLLTGYFSVVDGIGNPPYLSADHALLVP